MSGWLSQPRELNLKCSQSMSFCTTTVKSVWVFDLVFALLHASMYHLFLMTDPSQKESIVQQRSWKQPFASLCIYTMRVAIVMFITYTTDVTLAPWIEIFFKQTNKDSSANEAHAFLQCILSIRALALDCNLPSGTPKSQFKPRRSFYGRNLVVFSTRPVLSSCVCFIVDMTSRGTLVISQGVALLTLHMLNYIS